MTQKRMGRKLRGKQKRINQTVRVEPLVIEKIKEKFGGIQAFFDSATLGIRREAHEEISELSKS